MIAFFILAIVFGLHTFGRLCVECPGDEGLPDPEPSGVAGSITAGCVAVLVLAVIGGF